MRPDRPRPDHPRTEQTLRARALENVRLLVERNHSDSGLDRAPADPLRIRSVGIVGAGMMGSAIAAVHVKQNRQIVITDADQQALDGVLERIDAELADEVPGAEIRRLVDRLVRPTTDLATVTQCDLVIESVVESSPAKQRLFAQLDRQLSDHAILASNTSTIPIGRLATALAEPERFCGYHFFHPVRRRALVEIIRGPRTSDRTIATAVAHAKAIDKMPIVVSDGPGFLVNRLLFPYLGEALALLLEGVRIEDVERAATGFGMAKGPLTLLDEIGLDTALQSGFVLAGAFPERLVRSPLLVTMVKAGYLGRKSGEGFFEYHNGLSDPQPARTKKAVEEFIARWAVAPRHHTTRSITARLLLPMVLEATRILEEGKVRDPRDVDLGSVFGLGFPASRGGLLWWTDTFGAARIVDELGPLADLGARGRPTPLLKDLARSGGRFYGGGTPGDR